MSQLHITDEQRNTLVLLCCRYGLSARESDVVICDLIWCASRERVAHDLCLTRETVTKYRRRICEKFYAPDWMAVRQLCLQVMLTGDIPQAADLWDRLVASCD